MGTIDLYEATINEIMEEYGMDYEEAEAYYEGVEL